MLHFARLYANTSRLCFMAADAAYAGLSAGMSVSLVRVSDDCFLIKKLPGETEFSYTVAKTSTKKNNDLTSDITAVGIHARRFFLLVMKFDLSKKHVFLCSAAQNIVTVRLIKEREPREQNETFDVESICQTIINN